MTTPSTKRLTLLEQSTLRPAREHDQAYVATTWIHSMHENADLVDRVLERKTVRFVVAHPNGYPDRIVGWACYERQPRTTLLHMMYVRRRWRRQGLGEAMLIAATAGRDLPLVVTAKQVPNWEGLKCTKMSLQELLNP